MSIPRVQIIRIGAYILNQMILGRRRFPLVLMLEPSFRCNLACMGCGKIAYPDEVLKRRLSISDCIEAVETCPAPVVSIPGGEPLLLLDLPAIIKELITRKRFVYLCTNATLVEKRMTDFTPSPYLTFNIHIDGLAEQHDAFTNRKGVFDQAVSAIKLLLSRGFRVTTNTTFFNNETPENMARLFDFLTQLGVEGMTIAPAFHYDRAPSDGEFFLHRNQTTTLFQNTFKLGIGKNWRFNHSRSYLQFLAGHRKYGCTPWGTVTRNIFGWQRPCYLIDDGHADSFQQMMETTNWQGYGVGRDPRCAHCMMHCGFEPTAVLDAVKHPIKTTLLYLKEAVNHGMKTT